MNRAERRRAAKIGRMLTVAYRPADDVLQIAIDTEAPGDLIGVGRGILLAIAKDDGSPVGMIVNGFFGRGWRGEIRELARLAVAHMPDLRPEAVAEGIGSAISELGRRVAA